MKDILQPIPFKQNIHLFPRIFLFIFILLFICPASGREKIFDWTNTEIQLLHGDGYLMPNNPKDIGRSIITVTHADGWAYGRNFFFMDTLISDTGEPSQVNLYGEVYSYLSLSKTSGQDLSFAIFKDFSLAGGFNAGENVDSKRSGTRVVLYGINVEFNLPGFKFFSVDFLRHDIVEPVAFKPSWQITPVWKFPFTLFGAHWSLEGFADFVGQKGPNYARNALAQPQLRLDVGDFWGNRNHLFVGIEYQYWHNKYGIRGLHESLPQALLMWKF